jgi:hypothetical protein
MSKKVKGTVHPCLAERRYQKSSWFTVDQQIRLGRSWKEGDLLWRFVASWCFVYQVTEVNVGLNKLTFSLTTTEINLYRECIAERDLLYRLAYGLQLRHASTWPTELCDPAHDRTSFRYYHANHMHVPRLPPKHWYITTAIVHLTFL